MEAHRGLSKLQRQWSTEEKLATVWRSGRLARNPRTLVVFGYSLLRRHVLRQFRALRRSAPTGRSAAMRSLRSMAVDVALELGDQRLGFRGFCTGERERRLIPSYDFNGRQGHILRKTTEFHKVAATEGIHRARRADLDDRDPGRMIRTYPARGCIPSKQSILPIGRNG